MSTKKFQKMVFLGVVFLTIGSCGSGPATATDSRKEVKNKASADPHDGYDYPEYATETEEGYILIRGQSGKDFREARLDSLEKLTLLLGESEWSIISVSEASRIFDEFEDPGMTRRAVSIRGESSTSTRGTAHSLLPPIEKIEEWSDRNFFYSTLFIKTEDRMKTKSMIEAIKFFKREEGEESMNMGMFYAQKILVLNSVSTARQAASLANLLEKTFFVQTVVARDNKIFLYPKDRYESRVVSFLEEYFERVDHTEGNEINLFGRGRLEAFADNGLNLRVMKITSNQSVPELYHILRENGITEGMSRPRFVCDINFQEFNKNLTYSVNIDIRIIDKKDDRVLLSHTLISPNYIRNASVQALSLMKQTLADYMAENLPQILISY
jgi:hypothetical protein